MSKFVKPLDHIFTRTKIAEREVAFGPFFLRVTVISFVFGQSLSAD